MKRLNFQMTDAQRALVHDNSMKILAVAGVVFHEPKAIDLFREHGFKTDGVKVFFTEEQVMHFVKRAPRVFTIRSRNCARQVEIGGTDPALLPGAGAAFLVEQSGRMRPGSYEDHQNICKLVQTSPVLNMGASHTIAVADRPASCAHLDTLLSTMTLCDKPFLATVASHEMVMDMMTLAGFIWGDKASCHPFAATVINPLSPLQYSHEMCTALMSMVSYGQAVVVASALMGGATGPIRIEGMLAQQNAEILAGIVLAQLVRSGAEVVYGATSAVMDMLTGNMATGSPESLQLIGLTARMADFYALPCRAGGGLTDALACDAQAGIESALSLQATFSHKVDFVLHACGILGAFIAMSYEKFLIDEEICLMIRSALQEPEFSADSLDLSSILEVGPGGHFLTHPSTLEHYATKVFMPQLTQRQSPHAWQEKGAPTMALRAADLLGERLAAYVKPDLDPSIEKRMRAFVETRRS